MAYPSFLIYSNTGNLGNAKLLYTEICGTSNNEEGTMYRLSDDLDDIILNNKTETGGYKWSSKPGSTCFFV